jgi:RNA polymerase sigma factor (sigma-70 family)
MATSELKRVIQTLRSATLHHDEAGLTDGQLLERYVRSREEAAFAALVRRHGPMVWGVCRRVLDRHHDAEDAFQATFLVLVRKAATVVSVANWLFGVAHQTALKARATTARRRGREKQVTAMPEPEVAPQELWQELQPLLDQELSRLPDKYRTVIVQCDLQGKTLKEAARHLSIPLGTVASRLATARAMLAKRLARHGLAVSGAALAAVLGPKAASARVPLSVVSNTIQAATLFAAGQAAAPGVLSVKAVALTEGVLKTMLLTKLKIATAVLLVVAALGAGAAALTQPASADQPPEEKKGAEKLPRTVRGVVKTVDVEKNTLTVAHKDGETTFSVAKDAVIVISGKRDTLAGLSKEARVKLELSVDQKTASRIDADGGPELEYGPVKAVDGEKNTITDGKDTTYSVAREATIVIEGKPGKLTDVPVGARLRLILSADQKTARRIYAFGPELVNLTVKAVDADKGTITDRYDMVFSVTKDTKVEIEGKPGKLADVPVGALFHALLSADQKTVRRIKVEGPEFSGGLIKAVDADKGTVTFDDDRAPPELVGKTFSVAKDADIRIDGKPGKLAELPPGAVIQLLSLYVDQKTARRLSAQGPEFGAVVKAVDADKGTITLDDDKGPPELVGRTLPVAKDADIQIDEKPGKLAELPPGTSVNVRLSADRKMVRRISAEGSKPGGLVKAVDAEKSTITFDEEKASPELVGKTIPVAKDADIQIDDKPGGLLAAVPPGAFVQVHLSADQKTARRVFAQGPECGGLVKAVDGDKSTITFDEEKGDPELVGKTFPVANDAHVQIDDKPGKLAGVPPGALVRLRLSADRKTGRFIFAQGPEHGALVKAVDAEKGTITFDEEKAPPELAGKTFPVAKDADIRSDGKPSKLAAIQQGATVRLRLSADQKTIRRVEEGP